MALELKECIIPNGCTSFYFAERTGAYDAVLNPTGWGAPNAAIGDASAATLTITYAGATTPLAPVDINPPFPVSTVDNAYEVTAASLGLDEFPSGWMRVTYSVTVAGPPAVTYTVTQLVLIDCDLDCCISEKMIDAASAVVNGDCCDDCQEDKVMNALFLEAVLEGTRAATCSGLEDVVTTNVEYLETQCGESPCSGC